MSYQVLARKWRPRSFGEMVGQEHVLKALINALDHNRLHHAYLFTGTRGVGKTTVARILAKCLNCETGVGSSPCGVCSTCVGINEGRFVDLIEVDAASRTKVEDTRELLDNVQYSPTSGRYKIYLIDEVHMLSNSSFNALLKTLEEPPEHVKFLLATTDPQKLPATILSRCLQFNLKNMSPEKIVAHLQNVLSEEMVPFEQSALWQLARAADGSMRDALSLTDQAIAFGNGKLDELDVTSMLGTIDHKFIQNIVEALIHLDGAQLLSAVATFSEHAPDYSAALADLQTLLHRIAIAQALPEALDNSYGDRQQILQFATQMTPEDVQLFYQTSLMGQRDLSLCAVPRTGFEMVLLRMLAFKPQGLVDVPKNILPPAVATEAVNQQDQTVPLSSGSQSSESQSSEYVPADQASSENNTPIAITNDATANSSPRGTQEAPPVGHQQEDASGSLPHVPTNTQAQLSNEHVNTAQPSIAPFDSGAVIVSPKGEETEKKPESSASNSAHVHHADVIPNHTSTSYRAELPASKSPVAQVASVQQPSFQKNHSVDVANALPQQTAYEELNSPAAHAVSEPQACEPSGSVAPIAGANQATREQLLANIAEIENRPNGARPAEAPVHVDKTLSRIAPGPRIANAVKVEFDTFLPEQWIDLFYQLPLTGVVRMTASNLVCVGRQQHQFYFVQDELSRGLLNTEHAQYLSDALSDYFAVSCKAEISVATIEPNIETPAQFRDRRRKERRLAAIEDLKVDPVVVTLQQEFGAVLDEHSVKIDEEQV